ncbi:hypothetical protein [Streptomyces sp. RKAG337]|uniref:hypothetical protein n=1 Tax=Streptomyces sp. RKAG337 TaxID=2893404 RepID=UPI0020337BD7|nr:hypothetical protein [Streptomyces sp. RKAG337]MCM2430072.1 hypothetical protein [Streptomyces sp. RKAG337]
MPVKVAAPVRSADLEPAERTALDQGATVRRGQGYTLRVTAVPAVHRQFLGRCQPLDGGQDVPAVPARRKARREYKNRVSTLAPIGPCSQRPVRVNVLTRWDHARSGLGTSSSNAAHAS